LIVGIEFALPPAALGAAINSGGASRLSQIPTAVAVNKPDGSRRQQNRNRRKIAATAAAFSWPRPVCDARNRAEVAHGLPRSGPETRSPPKRRMSVS